MSKRPPVTSFEFDDLLVVANVGVRFGGLHALRDISFTVRKGETFGIIGPNGAGKTTLLNAISGLVRTRTGSINFAGTDIAGKRSNQIAGLGVGRSFQLAEGFARFTVWDYVRLGRVAVRREASMLPEAGVDFDAGSLAALERFGLSDLGNSHMGLLSYGTRKLVDLARVMAGEPEILLLDEPTSGLSRAERQEMTRHVRNLGDEGRTVLVVDHDVGFISEVASSALALAYGEAMCVGPLNEVLAHPKVVNSYLGSTEEV
jgi:ABC-type branched-subunit amino acid transport system ATPase component